MDTFFFFGCVPSVVIQSHCMTSVSATETLLILCCFGCRYMSQAKHAEARELMYNGALLFFSYNQVRVPLLSVLGQSETVTYHVMKSLNRSVVTGSQLVHFFSSVRSLH